MIVNPHGGAVNETERTAQNNSHSNSQREASENYGTALKLLSSANYAYSFCNDMNLINNIIKMNIKILHSSNYFDAVCKIIQHAILEMRGDEAIEYVSSELIKIDTETEQSTLRSAVDEETNTYIINRENEISSGLNQAECSLIEEFEIEINDQWVHLKVESIDSMKGEDLVLGEQSKNLNGLDPNDVLGLNQAEHSPVKKCEVRMDNKCFNLKDKSMVAGMKEDDLAIGGQRENLIELEENDSTVAPEKILDLLEDINEKIILRDVVASLVEKGARIIRDGATHEQARTLLMASFRILNDNNLIYQGLQELDPDAIIDTACTAAIKLAGVKRENKLTLMPRAKRSKKIYSTISLKNVKKDARKRILSVTSKFRICGNRKYSGKPKHSCHSSIKYSE